MRCLYCSGEMERTKEGYSINRKGYHLYLTEVPVYVCTKCKEKIYEESEIEVIQRLIKHLESDVHSLQVVD